MESNKIIRSICIFAESASSQHLEKANEIEAKLQKHGFIVQTKRICTKEKSLRSLAQTLEDKSVFFSIGSISTQEAKEQFADFIENEKATFNINLRNNITPEDINFLFEVVAKKPSKTFSFTYVFNNAPSSPYFPSATYQKDGFSIGLQPTDLSEDCDSIEEWLKKMKQVWDEIHEIFQEDPTFLGIDSSIAPLFSGKSSLINFLKRIGMDFSHAATTNAFLKITEFIKKENPKPVGLCGLMIPCVEDFELTEEYEKGNFSIERNVFLSLHSGLGIDTYPIGIDESPERILEILQLIQGLSDKYQKPLSARFVSDGKAKIGEKTDFQNQYLKDTTIKKL